MIFLLLAAVLATDPAAAVTEHYEVRSTALDPAEAAAILEQLHGCLAGFFGTAPPGRLQVEIFADAESFRQALVADGHPAVAAGGYYAPENRKVYLFVQPSKYFTRQLLLHEATHQFHFLASTGNRKPRTAWYVEGLAELFAMHNWSDCPDSRSTRDCPDFRSTRDCPDFRSTRDCPDSRSTKMGLSLLVQPSPSITAGQPQPEPSVSEKPCGRLEFGVVPAVSLEDYPAKALEELQEHAGQPDWLRRVIAGEAEASRPLAWALAHFLFHRDAAAFRDLVARLDREEDALDSFRKTFGAFGPQLFDDLLRWVAEHQQPWSVVWIEWQESGEAIEGFSQVVGLVVHKTPLDRLQATIEPAAGSWKAGGVFGFQSTNDFGLVELSDSGWVRVIRRAGSQWQPVLAERLPHPSQTFAIERRGLRVAVLVGEQTVCQFDARGKMGLFVDACRAKFSSIATTP